MSWRLQKKESFLKFKWIHNVLICRSIDKWATWHTFVTSSWGIIQWYLMSFNSNKCHSFFFVIKVCAFPILSSSTKFFLNVVESQLLLVSRRYWHRSITSFYQWLQTQRARKTSSIGGWRCVLERSGWRSIKIYLEKQHLLRLQWYTKGTLSIAHTRKRF